MLKDLVYRNRTYRRYYQDVPISMETLRGLVDLARMSASGANLQPLKYFLSCDSETNKRIFPYLAWAGYLKEWPGPVEGERPSAYILVLGDTEIAKNFGVDPGIAFQSIMLGAVEQGLGGCIIASVQRDNLRREFNIPERFEILDVLALGKPKEQVFVEKVADDGSIKYYRDEAGGHHVPKRDLDDLVVKF